MHSSLSFPVHRVIYSEIQSLSYLLHILAAEVECLVPNSAQKLPYHFRSKKMKILKHKNFILMKPSPAISHVGCGSQMLRYHLLSP